jgi:hypothetical protein
LPIHTADKRWTADGHLQIEIGRLAIAGSVSYEWLHPEPESQIQKICEVIAGVKSLGYECKKEGSA